MTNSKQLKPPYYRLTAVCQKHGEVTVERKPNPNAGKPNPNGTGQLITPYSATVVCPKCSWHCTVSGAVLVEVA